MTWKNIAHPDLESRLMLIFSIHEEKGQKRDCKVYKVCQTQNFDLFFLIEIV